MYFPFPKIAALVAEFRLRTDRSAVKIEAWELFSFNSWIYTGETFTISVCNTFGYPIFLAAEVIVIPANASGVVLSCLSAVY